MNIKKYKPDIGFLLLILSIFLLWYLGKFLHIDIQSIQKPLTHFPLAISCVIYVVLYVVVTFFIFFSKDIFYLAAALLFGPYLSAALVFIAEIINAVILFSLSRILGRDYVENSVSGRYKNLDERIGSLSLFWLFIFRAAPLIPYRFLDLAAGLTKIRFKKYLLACLLGSPVKIFWIQYVLYGVGESVFTDSNAIVDYFSKNTNLLFFSLIYIILVALVIFKIGRKQ